MRLLLAAAACSSFAILLCGCAAPRHGISSPLPPAPATASPRLAPDGVVCVSEEEEEWFSLAEVPLECKHSQRYLTYPG